jgi:hypothetical protein
MVRVQQKHAAEPQVAGSTGLPCAMVLRLIRDLPGDEFVFVTVAPRIDGVTHPVGPIDASARAWHQQRMPEPHDFTVRNIAARLARCDRSWTFAHPAIRPTAHDIVASTASHPNVRDDRDTPLVRDEMPE